MVISILYYSLSIKYNCNTKREQKLSRRNKKRKLFINKSIQVSKCEAHCHLLYFLCVSSFQVMATSILDLDADEEVRNLSKRHLENVSSFLSTLLTNKKNTFTSRKENQNERRLWTYAKSRLFQLEGNKKTSEIGRKYRTNNGDQIVCPKCPNPTGINLVRVKKFLKGPGKNKSILRLSYMCDLCHYVLRKKITLTKRSRGEGSKNNNNKDNINTNNKKNNRKNNMKYNDTFTRNSKTRFSTHTNSSSQMLINTSSSSNKLASDSPSLSNLQKLLGRRRSGIDAKTGLLDFLLECNKK